MPILKGSRYQSGTIYSVPDTNKKQVDNRQFLELENFQNWEIIVYEDKDTLDIIAFNFYGDAKLWWVIADVNHIAFPLEIDIGTRLFIPDFFEVKLLLEHIGVI